MTAQYTFKFSLLFMGGYGLEAVKVFKKGDRVRPSQLRVS